MSSLENYFPFRVEKIQFHVVSTEPHILKKLQRQAFHESRIAILFTPKIWKLVDFQTEFPELECEEMQLKKKYILVKNVPSNYPKMLHLMEIYKNSGLEMYLFLTDDLKYRWLEEEVVTPVLMRKKVRAQMVIDLANEDLLLFFNQDGSKTHAIGVGEQWREKLISFQ
ncbi:hypothetical protein HB852_08065 [Listeria grandensis]|uniref:Uncharacterized protein n=1 Tax=Listeria grandensis TaxID=1494963 RepID=A0A7X0Y2A2_9LIST|nr:hypothetical protein [Listeria grandensis]MBC1474572.1 hypothetical protein [Listeria grandensis]MBC1935700.1 hypothetical protein [Listeria grandensis]